MSTPLSLQEASRLVDTLSTEEAMTDERIQEFIGRIETAGKDILKSKADCGEYVEDATTFIMAAVVAECLGSDDIADKLIAVQMLKHSGMFKLIIGYSFIYAVGICATEELR